MATKKAVSVLLLSIKRRQTSRPSRLATRTKRRTSRNHDLLLVDTSLGSPQVFRLKSLSRLILVYD